MDEELSKYREWLDPVREKICFLTPFFITGFEPDRPYECWNSNLLFSILDACKAKFGVEIGERVHFMESHTDRWDVTLKSLALDWLSDVDESDHGLLTRWRYANKCRPHLVRHDDFTWLPLLRPVDKWNPDFDVQLSTIDDVQCARIPTRYVPSSVFDWLNAMLCRASPTKTYSYLGKAPNALGSEVEQEIDAGADVCIQLNYVHYRKAVESLLLGADITDGGLLDPMVRRFSGILDCVGHDTLEVHATLSIQRSIDFGES